VKRILYILLLLTLGSCAQYEVVQKLDVNMYHLQNVRTKDVQVIISSDELIEGSLVKLKRVRIIAEIEK
jgi:outer membrane lipoprotein-sorting protein